MLARTHLKSPEFICIYPWHFKSPALDTLLLLDSPILALSMIKEKTRSCEVKFSEATLKLKIAYSRGKSKGIWWY